MSNSVSLELIKTLRERTGAGMMECKKALTETNGDIEAAVEAMRIRGQATADKKAGRTAAEGLIVIKATSNGLTAAICETNCETDFTSGNENFRNFAEKITEIALEHRTDSVEALLNLPYDAQTTIEEARKNLVAKTGENVQVRRLAILNSDEKIASYIHNGRIGAMVKTQGANEVLGKDLAMQIVASNPIVVTPQDVPENLLAKEKEIFSEQAKSSEKPANIIEKMIDGRMDKFRNEVSLTGQAFVKDPSTTIKQLLEKSNAKVISFVRFEVGEGIEKSNENFAEEVMKQVRNVQQAT